MTRYLVAIHNTRDNTFRSFSVCDSFQQFQDEFRSFLHSHPETAYAMFPDNWQIVAQQFEDGSILSSMQDGLPDFTIVPFQSLVPEKK